MGCSKSPVALSCVMHGEADIRVSGFGFRVRQSITSTSAWRQNVRVAVIAPRRDSGPGLGETWKSTTCLIVGCLS